MSSRSTLKCICIPGIHENIIKEVIKNTFFSAVNTIYALNHLLVYFHFRLLITSLHFYYFFLDELRYHCIYIKHVITFIK